MGEDRVWRTRGGKPPVSVTHPDLAAELVDRSLGDTLTAGSNKKVQWRCLVHPDHPYTLTVYDKVRSVGCGVCHGQQVAIGYNDLATARPDLIADLWDPGVGSMLATGSNKSVLWRCGRHPEHPYRTTITSRVSVGRGCGICDGRQVAAGVNDLATTHPAIAALLVDRNLGEAVTAGSHKVVLWHCERHPEHPVRLMVKERVGRGCGACAGMVVLQGFNDLATLRPDLAAELVDQDLGHTLTIGSGKKVQWRCADGHQWATTVSSRTNMRSGCPECAAHGFSPIAPAWLYLIATPGRSVLKYGVTNNLEQRLDQHRRQGITEVLETIMFDTGAEAIAVERSIRAHSKSNGWTPAMTSASMPFGGATETLLADEVGDDFTLRDFR